MAIAASAGESAGGCALERGAAFRGIFLLQNGREPHGIHRACVHATEFVEGGRSLLEDVWITAYGGAGERFDNLHTHTCDYLTASEKISCAGDVQIELDRAADQAKAPNGPPDDDPRLVHVATSHVFFDHKSGLATTDRPVSFRFSQGEGQGVGFRYETQQGEMQLLSAVELALHQADPSGKDG